MNILHIDSSPRGASSVSRQLSANIVRALAAANPNARVSYRDLAANAPSHLTDETMQVVKFGRRDDLTPAQLAELDQTNALVDEFLAADVVVVGAPMYNFSVPTQLKAWMDRLAQAGKTFRYTEKGAEGLAGGRKVIIASTRGGRYAGTPMEQAFDHQEAYLKAFLLFLGVTDVSVIRAEGVALSPQAPQEALAAAQAEIDRLVPAPV